MTGPELDKMAATQVHHYYSFLIRFAHTYRTEPRACVHASCRSDSLQFQVSTSYEAQRNNFFAQCSAFPHESLTELKGHLVYKLVKGIGQVLFRQDLQVLLQVLSNQVLYLSLIQSLRANALSQGSTL